MANRRSPFILAGALFMSSWLVGMNSIWRVSLPQARATATRAPGIKGARFNATRLRLRRTGDLWASIALIPDQTIPNAASANDASEASDDLPLQGYHETLSSIRQNYFGRAPNDSTLTYGAIRGMLRSLGDRYTRFLDPEQFRRLEEENSGEFGGIGATVTINSRYQAEITQIDPGSPAKKANLKIHDVVLEVSGHPIYPGHAAAERAEDLIHGNPGTVVSLKIRRKGTPSSIKATMKRYLVYTPTVTSRIIKSGIGYLKLDSFGERSDDEVGFALRQLKAKGLKALIFDMRGNPGGYFNAAIDIASRFIDHGPVVYTKDRDDHRIPVPSIPSKRLIPPVQVIVLVDRWSASAAEIVTAAIQDTGSGIVIGQPTYGKALVQRINPIPDGSALLVTTDHYYTPKGTDISHKGVRPNIVLDPSPTNATVSDKAFQRAVSLLSLASKSDARSTISSLTRPTTL